MEDLAKTIHFFQIIKCKVCIPYGCIFISEDVLYHNYVPLLYFLKGKVKGVTEYGET